MNNEVLNVSHLFHKYLGIFKKNIIKIVVLTIIGILIGAYFAATKESKFKSHFSLFFDSGNGGNINQYLGLAQSFGFDLGSGKNDMSPENIAELAVSNHILSEVLFSKVEVGENEKKLINLYLDSVGVPEIRPDNVFTDDFRIKAQSYTKTSIDESRLINEIFKDIKTKILGIDISSKTSVIRFKVELPNEHVAYVFSKSFIHAIKCFLEQRTSKRKLETIKILSNKSDSIKSILISSEERLASISDKNNYVVRKKARLEELRLAREIEILSTMYALNLRNLEIAKFTYQETRDAFNILDRPMLPLEKTQSNTIIYSFVSGSLFFLTTIAFLLIYSRLKIDLKQIDRVND
jgi:hypothetical protein